MSCHTVQQLGTTNRICKHKPQLKICNSNEKFDERVLCEISGIVATQAILDELVLN